MDRKLSYGDYPKDFHPEDGWLTSPQGKTVIGSSYAKELEDLASRFEEPKSEDSLLEYELREQAGNYTVLAYKLGLLSLMPQKLEELIIWHTSPSDDDPKAGIDRQAVRRRCPSNLFLDLIGGQIIELSFDNEGRVKDTRPKLDDGLFPAIGVIKRGDASQGCRFLAKVIVEGVKQIELSSKSQSIQLATNLAIDSKQTKRESDSSKIIVDVPDSVNNPVEKIASNSWSLRKDCLIPLSQKLHALRSRFRTDYQQDYAKGHEPITARDIEYLYKDYRIIDAFESLKFHVSIEYAEDFKSQLDDLLSRFRALEFKANQRINGETDTKETRFVRYALQKVCSLQDLELKTLFPDHGCRPESSEMPDELREIEIAFEEEFSEVQVMVQDLSRYLATVAALLKSKASHSHEDAKPKPNQSSRPPNRKSIDSFIQNAKTLLKILDHSDWELTAHIDSYLRSIWSGVAYLRRCQPDIESAEIGDINAHAEAGRQCKAALIQLALKFDRYSAKQLQEEALDAESLVWLELIERVIQAGNSSNTHKSIYVSKISSDPEMQIESTKLITIDQLEKETPALDKKNGDWAMAKDLKKYRETVSSVSLDQQRSRGQKTEDGKFGKCEVGRFWRKDEGRVWYFVPSLRK